MFEHSLVVSRVGGASSGRRWTAVASFGTQVAIAGVVIVLPLLHPEALPFHVEAPKVLLPMMTKPPVPVERVQEASPAASSVGAHEPVQETMLPSLLQGRGVVDETAPALAPSGMGAWSGLPSGIVSGGGPVVSVARVKATVGPVRVSSGVSKGMLLAPITAVYPAIAKASHVEGRW
jgi:protein TonB